MCKILIPWWEYLVICVCQTGYIFTTPNSFSCHNLCVEKTIPALPIWFYPKYVTKQLKNNFSNDRKILTKFQLSNILEYFLPKEECNTTLIFNQQSLGNCGHCDSSFSCMTKGILNHFLKNHNAVIHYCQYFMIDFLHMHF